MASDADDLLARQLAELRGEYLAEADKRVAELRALRNRLALAPADALSGLRQAFHRLAGSGGSYGFPDVSARSRDGEQLAQRLLDGGAAVGQDDLAPFDQCIASVERAFADARTKQAKD